MTCPVIIEIDTQEVLVVELPSTGPAGPQGPAGPGGEPWDYQSFTPTAGQITFILHAAPTDVASVVFEVNGVDYHQGDSFTVSGQTVTWLEPWAMETTDFVTARWK